MTPKEIQKRNGKAQQLRVIQVEEGNFYVESGDRKVAYKCLVTDEKELCTYPINPGTRRVGIQGHLKITRCKLTAMVRNLSRL